MKAKMSHYGDFGAGWNTVSYAVTTTETKMIESKHFKSSAMYLGLWNLKQIRGKPIFMKPQQLHRIMAMSEGTKMDQIWYTDGPLTSLRDGYFVLIGLIYPV